MASHYTDVTDLHRGYSVNSHYGHDNEGTFRFDYQHQSLQNSYSRDNEGRFGYDIQHTLQNNIPENFIQMRGGGGSTFLVTLMFLHTILEVERITLKGGMPVADITLDMIMGIKELNIKLPLILFQVKIVHRILTMIGSIQTFQAKMQETKQTDEIATFNLLIAELIK